MYRVILSGIVGLAMSATFFSSAHAVEVYLFKGAGDFSFVSEKMHFSRGLNQIADTLNAEGIHAEVRRFGAVEDALKTIRKRKPESVVLIGHSMGALASMSTARNLRAAGVRIAYMGLIDIPGPVGVAGDNVEWVQNYYSINPVYGLLTNVKSHPNAKNIHVAGYVHSRMDDAPRVQEGMLAAIREVHQKELLQNQVQQPGLTFDPNPSVREVLVQAITPEPKPYVVPGPTPPVQDIDPVTTAFVPSEPEEGLLQQSKRLLRKTGDFVRDLSSGNRNGSNRRKHDSNR